MPPSSDSMPPGAAYVTTILGDGTICPISEVIGRRRVRRIAADSVEGRRLLRTGRVTILARDGKCFTGTPIDRVFDDLAGELHARADDPLTDPRAAGDLADLARDLRRRSRSYS